MTGNSRVVGVVEDDASVRGALHRLFRKAGFETILFATAEDFFADPRHVLVDCLVIDVGLPGIGGLELLERVRGDRAVGPAAVVITAHDDELVRKRAVAAGAIDFFAKPFDNHQLQSAVRKGMDMSEFG